MPKGMRRSLYLKDDDYRLGFLYGNFVTLTNLTEDDWRGSKSSTSARCMSRSTRPTARCARCCSASRMCRMCSTQIRRFGELGIDVHTQIVALPGLNDGAALHQSIRELAALLPDRCRRSRLCRWG